MARRSARQSARGSSRRSGRGGARASGRAGGGRASARGSARGSARASERAQDDEAGSRREKAPSRKKGGGGMELAICLGVIAVLGVTCTILYSVRSTEKQQFEEENRRKAKAQQENTDRAFNAFQKAMRAGAAFVKGEHSDAKTEELFASFQGDELIYNVIFNRKFKDKHNKDQTDQRVMHKDRLQVNKIANGARIKEGIAINRAKTTGEELPLMYAEKFIPGAEGDKANLGGEIIVMVRAVKEK